jgi:PAS domain S-box-containing protein
MTAQLNQHTDTLQRATDALRSSETRYHTLVEHIPLGIYEIDADGRLLSINPAALRMLGARAAVDVLGQPLIDLMAAPNSAYTAPLIARAYAGEAVEVEYTLLLDGQRRVFTATIVSPPDTDGSGRKIILMAQDITERMQARLEAEIERDRLDAVLESSNDGIIMFALDDRLAVVNRAWSNLFGLAEADALGLPYQALFAQITPRIDQPDRFIETLTTLFAKPHHEASGEIAIRCPEYHALVWYSVPVRTRAGTSLGRLVFFRDATRERQADQMKTEFVSIVSHELRTPLTSIKGFTDLILEGDAGAISPTVREFLELVKTSADQLVAITNDIMETSRIEAGRIALNLQPVVAAEIVYITADSIQPLLADKRQTLTIDLASDLIVCADRDRLMQILNNLLSNAHKYTPPDGQIRVYARRAAGPEPSAADAPAGRYLVVGVADNGIGISPQDQEHLFTRFYRIASTETQGISGTGLGLHITRSLVELHGGAIWVESERGRGSTFFFSLPLITALAGLWDNA